MTNLLEYVFGTNPVSGASGPGSLPVVAVSGGALRMSFAVSPTATGVTVRGQTSTDLQTWTDLVNIAVPPLHTYAVPVSGKARQWMRVKVTMPRGRRISGCWWGRCVGGGSGVKGSGLRRTSQIAAGALGVAEGQRARRTKVLQQACHRGQALVLSDLIPALVDLLLSVLGLNLHRDGFTQELRGQLGTALPPGGLT